MSSHDSRDETRFGFGWGPVLIVIAMVLLVVAVFFMASGAKRGDGPLVETRPVPVEWGPSRVEGTRGEGDMKTLSLPDFIGYQS